MRVLDLTLNLPGPYATWVLARQGADVVKLEPPRGDPGRHLSAFFERVNQGKRSVCLDLRDPTSRERMQALLRWADVLVEGFRPGVMERLGFGPDEAHALNPRLIYCRISAFGQRGPRRAEPGHDLNLQALTGLAVLERDSDGTPRALRLPLADLSTSMGAVAAIHAALAGQRDRVVLDVAMADALLSWTWLWDAVDPGALAAEAAHQLPPPARAALRRPLARLRRRLARDKLASMPAYQLYAAADGWLAVGIVDEQRFWRAFAEAIGLSWASRLDMGTRTLLGPLLRRLIASRLRRATVTTWLERLAPLNLPVCEVLPVDRALRDPHLAARLGPSGAPAPLPGCDAALSPAPALGEHDAQVFASLLDQAGEPA